MPVKRKRPLIKQESTPDRKEVWYKVEKAAARPADDYTPIPIVYTDTHGSITSDGNVWQAWRQLSPTHTKRVGSIFYSLEDAIESLHNASATEEVWGDGE